MGSTMDYGTALHHLLSLVDLERTAGPPHRKYKLERMRALARRLGDPHLVTPTVHVTGTKGKGSTAAMVTSVLEQAGRAPGLYTSPHLHAFRERIRLGQEPVPEAVFGDLMGQVWPVIEAMAADSGYGRVTTFEALTAMAFLCYVQSQRGYQVLEVGLGGTLDATNIVERPLVCVITPISLDHTQVLGDTVEAIARDKAGIIKPGATVVVAPQEPSAMAVLEAACTARGARMVKVEEEYGAELLDWDVEGQTFRVDGPSGSRTLRIPLLGRHQIENACCAVAAAEALGDHDADVDAAAVEKGLRGVRWPGRLEVLGTSPLVVADGAHNPHAMRALTRAVREYFPGLSPILVMGFSDGHHLEGVVAEAAALQPRLVIATRSRHPRAVATRRIAEDFARYGVPVDEVEHVGRAVERAMELAGSGDLVLGTGSLFAVAEMREHLKGIPPEVYPEVQRPITAMR